MGKTVACATRINAAPERVFEVFTDLRNAPGRIKSIIRLEVLGEGPIGRGTRFRETRKLFGKEATETMEITAFDPPVSYTVEADSCGAHYVSRFEFRPENGATNVEMSFSMVPQSFMAKVMGMIMGGKMADMCRKMIEKDMTDLKGVIESGT
jgi:hypothetical protein